MATVIIILALGALLLAGLVAAALLTMSWRARRVTVDGLKTLGTMANFHCPLAAKAGACRACDLRVKGAQRVGERACAAPSPQPSPASGRGRFVGAVALGEGAMAAVAQQWGPQIILKLLLTLLAQQALCRASANRAHVRKQPRPHQLCKVRMGIQAAQNATQDFALRLLGLTGAAAAIPPPSRGLRYAPV
jgi:hypothetical protein